MAGPCDGRPLRGSTLHVCAKQCGKTRATCLIYILFLNLTLQFAVRACSSVEYSCIAVSALALDPERDPTRCLGPTVMTRVGPSWRLDNGP